MIYESAGIPRSANELAVGTGSLPHRSLKSCTTTASLSLTELDCGLIVGGKRRTLGAPPPDGIERRGRPLETSTTKREQS
eukprot:6213007-Pleurochrysis_carterae.AAC.3